MTSKVLLPMAWTNEKIRLSCAETIGLKQLWKAIIVDNNNTNTNNNKNIVLGSEHFNQFVSKRDTNQMSLLKFLAINALELSAPATPVLLQQTNKHSGWVQLAGHPESIVPGSAGIVHKRISGHDDFEVKAYQKITTDLRASQLAPKFIGVKEIKGESYIELQDLLYGFKDPNVMDIKMGCRTFLESEVNNKTLRHDLYNKMVAVDSTAPTAEEHQQKSVTKLRYMLFREQMSSSHTKGFRIEALRTRGDTPITDLKKIRTTSQIQDTILNFLSNCGTVTKEIIKKLKSMRTLMEESEFFRTHEVVGSSVFIVYDEEKVGAWIIDFAKTRKLPDGLTVDHRRPWVPGNHEEGILHGMDELIKVFEDIYEIQMEHSFRKCKVK